MGLPARVALSVGRNLLGAVLLACGLIMLFTPGQGLLFMLMGLAFMDFPGKHALIRWTGASQTVLRTLNHIRSKAGRPPFEHPDASTPENPDADDQHV